MKRLIFFVLCICYGGYTTTVLGMSDEVQRSWSRIIEEYNTKPDFYKTSPQAFGHAIAYRLDIEHNHESHDMLAFFRRKCNGYSSLTRNPCEFSWYPYVIYGGFSAFLLTAGSGSTSYVVSKAFCLGAIFLVFYLHKMYSTSCAEYGSHLIKTIESGQNNSTVDNAV